MPEFASLIVFSNNFISSFLYVIHHLNRNEVVKTKNTCFESVFLKPGKTFFFFTCREVGDFDCDRTLLGCLEIEKSLDTNILLNG